MRGKVTTHVLDLSIGKPASNVAVELWMVEADHELVFIRKSFTNEDGRVNDPFLEGSNMKRGVYQFHFYVGQYYRNKQSVLKDPLFLDCVPIRFTIAEPDSHYHVPLLISPGGYSTYRGS